MSTNKHLSYCGNEIDFKNYVNYLNEAKTKKKNIERKALWEKMQNKPYKDPDGTYDEENSIFYSKLIEFLNKQSNDENYNLCFEHQITKRPKGIKVNNGDIILRSDQFGFSAPKSKAWILLYNNKIKYSYPYGKYLLIEQDNYDANFVAETIWSTRQLGGSFVWPLGKEKRKNKNGKKYDAYCSKYNYFRGASSYIEDRVDYTLQEIKLFYHFYNKSPKEPLNKIYSDMKNACKYNNYIPILFKSKIDSELIFKWLQYFKTFENYINFFKFNDFVTDDYYVINIVTGKKIEVNNDQVIKEKLVSINDLSKMQIKNMLINLRTYIDRRTNRMLKNPNETNKE